MSSSHRLSSSLFQWCLLSDSMQRLQPSISTMLQLNLFFVKFNENYYQTKFFTDLYISEPSSIIFSQLFTIHDKALNMKMMSVIIFSDKVITSRTISSHWEEIRINVLVAALVHSSSTSLVAQFTFICNQSIAISIILQPHPSLLIFHHSLNSIIFFSFIYTSCGLGSKSALPSLCIW